LDNYTKFALGSLRGNVEVWDIAFPKRIKVVKAHKTAIISVIVMNSGLEGQILVSSSGNEVKLWDINTWFCKGSFSVDHNDNILCLRGQNSHTLFIGSNRGITSWNFRTGENCKLVIDEQITEQACHTIISSERYHLVCGYGKRIKSVLNSNPVSVEMLIGHERAVVALNISPQNDILVSGDHGGTLKIWNLETCQNTHTLQAHGGNIACLLLYSPGVLVSSSWDGTIKFWNMNTWKREKTFEAHRNCVGMMLIPKEGALVTIGDDKLVNFWAS